MVPKGKLITNSGEKEYLVLGVGRKNNFIELEMIDATSPDNQTTVGKLLIPEKMAEIASDTIKKILSENKFKTKK